MFSAKLLPFLLLGHTVEDDGGQGLLDGPDTGETRHTPEHDLTHIAKGVDICGQVAGDNKYVGVEPAAQTAPSTGSARSPRRPRWRRQPTPARCRSPGRAQSPRRHTCR